MIDLLNPKFTENPYPYLTEAREFAPISKVQPIDYYAVFRYDHVMEALKDPQVFSSAAMNETDILHDTLKPFFGQGDLIGMDPPIHTKARRIVSKPFTTKAMEAFRPSVEDLWLKQFEQLANKKKGEIDFISSLAAPFPIAVICKILGIDSDKTVEFKEWSNHLLMARVVSEWQCSNKKDIMIQKIAHSLKQMEDYFHEIIDQKNRRSGNDIISLMIQAKKDGKPLTAGNIFSMARLFLIAGNETTTNLLAHCVEHFCMRPDIWDQLKKDRSLLSPFIEEVLRFSGPAFGVFRTLTKDYQMSGTTFKQGERIYLLYASANRDETIFKDPDQFILERPEKKHIAFGTGVHNCIGSALARMEVEIVLNHLLESWSSIKMVGKLQRMQSFIIRGVSKLPLAYES